MSVNVTKDQLATDLEKLAKIKECPRLHLANYFGDLRADVDLEMANKEHQYRDDKEKKEKIMEIWLQMISEIY